MVTDVNNIVLRLKALDMENMLHVDNEFLSAVSECCPAILNQNGWNLTRAVSHPSGLGS